jgi:hypothetical protein
MTVFDRFRLSRLERQRLAQTFSLDPLRFARVEPSPYEPRYLLRLHRTHAGVVSGVKPRQIDLTRVLDKVVRDDDILDRPRQLDFPSNDR